MIRRRRSSLLAHTISSAVATGWSIVVTLTLLPILIRAMGPASYGVWILLSVFLFQGRGLVSLLDLGLQQSIIGRIAASPDPLERNRRLGASLATLAPLGLVSALALALFAPHVVGLVRTPPVVAQEAVLGLRVLALQLGIELPGIALASTLEGVRRYPARRALDALRVTLFAVGAVAATRTDSPLLGLAASSAVSSLVFFAGCAVALAAAGIRPVTGGSPREELRWSRPLLALRLTGIGSRQLDRVVLGLALGPLAVATFDVADRSNLVALTALGVATSALIPAAAESLRNDVRSAGDLLIRATRWSSFLTLVICGLLFALAEPMTTVLAGESLPGAATALRLLVVSTGVASLYAAGYEMAIGAGIARRLAPLGLLALAVNLVATLALAPRFGVRGSAFASLLSTSTIVVPLTVLISKQFRRRAVDLLRAAAPGATAASMSALTAWSVTFFGPDIDLIHQLGFAGALGIAPAAVVAIVVGRRDLGSQSA